jgi:hypothetical protein
MSLRKAAAAKAVPKAAATKPAATKPQPGKAHLVKPHLVKAQPVKPVALKTVAGKAAKPVEKPAEKAGNASADATRLAAEIERGLRDGKLDTLTPEAFQVLMAAMCKSYGTQREAGAEFLPVADRMSVSPTEIMTTTSGLLKAANLAVFELGMWQSWTGR